MQLADTTKNNLPTGIYIELEDATDLEQASIYANMEGRDPQYRLDAYVDHRLPLILGRTISADILHGLHKRTLAGDTIARIILTEELGFEPQRIDRTKISTLG